jgi:hypothetical protein
MNGLSSERHEAPPSTVMSGCPSYDAVSLKVREILKYSSTVPLNVERRGRNACERLSEARAPPCAAHLCAAHAVVAVVETREADGALLRRGRCRDSAQSGRARGRQVRERGATHHEADDERQLSSCRRRR